MHFIHKSMCVKLIHMFIYMETKSNMPSLFQHASSLLTTIPERELLYSVAGWPCSF